MLGAALLGYTPASAAGESLGVSLYSVGGSQVQFSICLTEGSALPARLAGTYTVSGGGGTIGPVDWSDADPSAVLIHTEPCPSAFITIAVSDLLPSTTYTINVHADLAPKVENDDGDFVDDTSRSTVSLDASLVTATAAGSSAEDGSGGDGSDTTGSTGSTGGSTGTGSTDGAVAPVVISNPSNFTAAQLAALTPAQVATITAATFGQLPPATFRALTASQAAALTVAQASSIRPARAAALRPATVAGLTATSVAAMRPAAIKFLSPQAIKAMTRAQLRALTARQIDALRPLQLAELTAGEKALLRIR